LKLNRIINTLDDPGKELLEANKKEKENISITNTQYCPSSCPSLKQDGKNILNFYIRS
jgi:hypothetical protein